MDLARKLGKKSTKTLESHSIRTRKQIEENTRASSNIPGECFFLGVFRRKDQPPNSPHGSLDLLWEGYTKK